MFVASSGLYSFPYTLLCLFIDTTSFTFYTHFYYISLYITATAPFLLRLVSNGITYKNRTNFKVP